MLSLLDYLNEWPREKRLKLVEDATDEQVLGALARESLRPADFAALISPAAEKHLEAIARRANSETKRCFGRAVQLFTPLYLADFCTNQCLYCGFSARNHLDRHMLSPEEILVEGKAIAATGLSHILLLTGDARKKSPPEYIAAAARALKPLFASIGVEVYSLTTEEYALLAESGVDSMTMFQETYDQDLYSYLHPGGPKRDYHFRLNAPSRAAEGGMRSVGIGALLGLDDFACDAMGTALHASWLMHSHPGVDISISVPRMCPHEGSFEVRHAVSDVKFAQYIAALRCFMPRAGITVSTRERAYLRDNLLALGVTRISAGVSTAVGGHAVEAETTGQFEISDGRSVAEMAAVLEKLGYQAVYKDWENPVEIACAG